MSSKVSKITVSNLKAVSELTADFNGCTAIITGGNNKGKSSFLRSLPDRIHGIKPEVILKKGEKEGYASWLLTSGEQFIWSFDNGDGKKKAGEKLTFITSAGIKGSVTRELALRYFPPTFNVDDFLQAAPKQQKATLQKLVGLDFTDVDKRYEEAYLDREGKNRRAHEQEIIFNDWGMPEQVQEVGLDQLMFDKAAVRNKLNTEYLSNKAANEKLRTAFVEECANIKREYDLAVSNSEKHYSEICRMEEDRVRVNNERAAAIQVKYNECQNACATLEKHGYEGDAIEWLRSIESSIPKKETYKAPPTSAPIPEPTYPKQPTYVPEMPDSTELNVVDEKILNAQKINQAAQAYKDWKAQERKMQESAADAAKAHSKVVLIEEEKMDMIRSAKMPEGFGFSGDGITYTDLPFTREQLSSSGIYIAALKLAAMTLGEVRTLHFDASFLDKNSLGEIEKWANASDLQLLIERPDFEGNEIEYQLLNCDK